MNTEKVSIVLPTYNGAEFIDQSIQSVINQTYQSWELIIVDDCSTDSTPEIIREYSNSDNRIRIIRNNNNLKLPASLNVGFSKATGVYYTWTSDDNIFDSDALEVMVEAFSNNPRADLVYCDVRRIDDTGHPAKAKQFSTSPQFLYLYNVIQACFLYRSTVHEELGGYDPSLFLVEDYDFWLRAFRKHQFIHIKGPHYSYRMHAKSLSSTRELEIRNKTRSLISREITRGDLPISKLLCAATGLIYNTVMYRIASHRLK